jgi:hypothetical protein
MVAGASSSGLNPSGFTILISPDLPWQSDGDSIFLQNDAGPAAT